MKISVILCKFLMKLLRIVNFVWKIFTFDTSGKLKIKIIISKSINEEESKKLISFK